jgi:hypothetical protein
MSPSAGLPDGIRELIEHLRAQAAAMVSLVDRLERLATGGNLVSHPGP